MKILALIAKNKEGKELLFWSKELNWPLDMAHYGMPTIMHNLLNYEEVDKVEVSYISEKELENYNKQVAETVKIHGRF